MSIFDTGNFQRSGNTDKDIRLDNTEDVIISLNELTKNALRTIRIFTPDLQHDLYDNDVFRDNLLKFARGNRHAQIQLLVTNSSFAIQQGHRLIRLAQQLTSAMQVRVTPEDYQETRMAFMLVDQSDFIFKADCSTSKVLQSSCKHRGNRLLEFFTPAWDQAELDIQIRRVSI